MEDSYQYLEGSKINCLPAYDCGAQGIQAGWADVYGATLDCQWVDITHLPEGGEFQLAVAINPARVFAEKSFENNEVVIRVRIPEFNINALGEHNIEVYSSIDFNSPSSNTGSNSPSSNTDSDSPTSNTGSGNGSSNSSEASAICLHIALLIVLLISIF